MIESWEIEVKMMKKIKIDNKESCVGCNACGDICPRGAIQFKEDGEGFYYPEIDPVKCVDCGLCANVCPIIHVDEIRKSNTQLEPEVLAGINQDLNVRFDSTSGGIFSALADVVFAAGGFVGGCSVAERQRKVCRVCRSFFCDGRFCRLPGLSSFSSS